MRRVQSKVMLLLMVTGALLLITITVFSGSASAKVSRYLSGNPEDVNPPLSGVAYNLGGGGLDVDSALQWMINTVRGCTDCETTVDVVVIRDTGSDGYNQPILQMDGVDSVETLVIAQRQDADRQDTVEAIKQAEVIFLLEEISVTMSATTAIRGLKQQ